MKDQEYEDAVKAVVDAANKADKARELSKESNAFAQDRFNEQREAEKALTEALEKLRGLS